MTSGTIGNHILQPANVGYRCLYPHCQERRPDYYCLAQHVEATHTTTEEIKKLIIRDRFGNIAALPPHCLFRYNPEVGLPQHQVKEVVASVLAEDYNPNQLLSVAQTAPVGQFLEPYGNVVPQMPYACVPMGSAPGALAQPYAQTKAAYNAALQQSRSVPGQILTAQASSKKPVKMDLPLEKFYEVTKQFESPADQAAAAQSILRILVNKKRQLDQMENSGALQPSVRTIWAPNGVNTAATEYSTMAPGSAAVQKQNLLPTTTAVRTAYGNVSSHTISSSVGVVTSQHSVNHPVYSVGKTVTSTVSCATGPVRTMTTGTVNAPTGAVNAGYHIAAPTFARMLSVTPAHSPDSGRGSESSAEDSFSNQLSPINATGAAVSTYAPSTASSRNVDDYDIDDSSNSSWTYVENYTEEMIISLSKEHAAKRMKLDNSGSDKPYGCVVPGCNKQYKNMQGIKYHAKSAAHKTRKGYRCTCGKKYATETEYKIHSSCCPGIHSSQTPFTPNASMESSTSSFSFAENRSATRGASLVPGSPQSPLVFVASPQKQLSQIAPNIANTPTLQHLLSRPVETTRTSTALPSMNSAGPLPPASVFASKGTGQPHSVLNSLLD